MISKVKAKFKCESVKHLVGAKEIKLYAVYGNNGENANYAKSTPSGDINIRVDEETAAAEFFIPGKEYYLEFIDPTPEYVVPTIPAEQHA